jgi:hypothetical protein
MFATPFLVDIISGKDSFSLFWIYWVVTVPLTLLVLGAWYFWVSYKEITP